MYIYNVHKRKKEKKKINRVYPLSNENVPVF